MDATGGFFAAIREQQRRQAAVYGRVPNVQVRRGPAKISAAVRRRNLKLWTPADHRWWRHLTPAQQRHHGYCVGWSKYGEAMQSAREQEADALAVKREKDRRVRLRRRAERELADAIRLHRPVRRLRDSVRYRWYLDPAAEHCA